MPWIPPPPARVRAISLVVEKIGRPAPGRRHPVCLAGQHACPPEDYGGYPGFVAATSNPEHPEHAEILEWIGGAFDLDAVNRALRRFHQA